MGKLFAIDCVGSLVCVFLAGWAFGGAGGAGEAGRGARGGGHQDEIRGSKSKKRTENK